MNASDNCYITAVRFTLGDGTLISTQTNWIEQPERDVWTYGVDWDSRSVPNGPVTITVLAEDARIVSEGDGTPYPNIGSESREFTVANP